MQVQKALEIDWKRRLYAWYRAARPKTLTMSVVPMILGTLLADISWSQINWFLAGCACLSSLCIQIGMNYVNDGFDGQKGVDTPERIGPKKITQSGIATPKQVLTVGFCFFALAAISGLPLIYFGGPIFALIIAVSITCGYIYTGGPYPLSYNGIADIFVLTFYGFVAVASAAYLQQGYVGWKALLAGAQLGLFANALMAINNIRDLKEDRKAHKKTLAVRFGLNFARKQITTLLLLPFALNIIWYINGYTVPAVLSTMNLPIALNIVRGTWTYDAGKVYLRYMIETSFVHFMFAFLLILGYYLQ